MKPTYYYFLFLILIISCKSSSVNGLQKITNFITKQYLTEEDFRVITQADRKFQYQTTDLNGDGINEYFVSFLSPYFCGSGGCNLLVLDNKFNLITNFTLTNPPILIDLKATSGWDDIILWSNGDYHRMKFNSKKNSYPTNPSVEEVIELESRDLERMTSLFENTADLKTYAF